MAPKYELVYFNGRARGEVCRLLFAAAEVAYEDKRVDFKDWPELKPNVPTGSLPVLKVDGKVTLSQSMAIARYLAREFKLYGATSLDAVYVDQLVDTIIDFQLEGFKTFFAKEDEKAAMVKTLETETIPKYLGILEKLVATTGKAGFCVGSSHTLADYVLFSCLENVRVPDDALAKYPLLTGVKKKVLASPLIEKYLKTRPVTEF